MENIQYFEIFKKALLLAWKNKFLWFFGFVVFIGGTISNLNINSDDIAQLGNKFDFFSQLIVKFPNFSITLSLFLFLVMVGLFLFRVIAIAAIIKGANDPNLFKQLSKKAIINDAKAFFGRLLWVELLISLALGVIFLVISVPVLYLFSVNAKIFAFMALVLAIVIFLPLLVLAYYLRRYANMYVVLGNFQLKMAFDAAYLLFEKNVKKSLLMGIISITTMLSLFILCIVLIIIVALVLSPFGLLAYWIFAKAGLAGVIIVGVILFLVALVALLSFYQIFLQAAWLYFFQEIALEKQKDVKIMEKISIEMEEMPSTEIG
jgi:hypothetical protein